MPIVSEPSPPIVIKRIDPRARKSPTSSSVRSTVTHVPSSCCTGKAVGLPRFVLPRIVPPRWPMPRTMSRVNSIMPPVGYSSGNISPLKPSRMPTTSQPRRAADNVAARMTALRPGASPPPVEIAIFTASD